MVGILVSFWYGLFSGAMLVSGSVYSPSYKVLKQKIPEVSRPQYRAKNVKAISGKSVHKKILVYLHELSMVHAYDLSMPHLPVPYKCGTRGRSLPDILATGSLVPNI